MSNRNKNILTLIAESTVVVILLLCMFFAIRFKFEYVAISNAICSCFIGILIKVGISTIIDIYDSMPWQTYLRVLLRTKEISNNTYLRISYAYLFRIEVDGKYLLIKNKNGINKYQPPGHTYHLSLEEKNYLKNKFHILEDDKLTTKKIKNDYRLRVKARYLKGFYNRFLQKIDKEHSENYFQGFKEKLLDSNILNKEIFAEAKFQMVRRDVQRISYSKFFQCYEMVLADIFEVILNENQIEYIRELIKEESNDYIFCTDKYIKALGVDPEKNDFISEIAEHAEKILPQ